MVKACTTKQSSARSQSCKSTKSGVPKRSKKRAVPRRSPTPQEPRAGSAEVEEDKDKDEEQDKEQDEEFDDADIR